MKQRLVAVCLLLCSVAFAAPGDPKGSYSASLKFAASSTTDNLVVFGNATTFAEVTAISFTCTQTTAAVVNFKLTKRSTADTGGTAANLTAVPDGSNFAAASTVPVSYTGTGPTAGTAVGDVDNEQLSCLATSTAVAQQPYVWRPAVPVKLHGATEGLALSLGGAVTGGNLTVTVYWTEKSNN